EGVARLMPPRSLAVAVAVALVAAPAARAATHVPDFTVSLPGDATAASVKADPDTWIVGAVPGPRSAALAKRFGARGAGLPPATSEHGTATAAVAAAPINTIGMDGVWPGARAVNSPLPNAEKITCEDSANGIRAAIVNIENTPNPVNPHAPGVINMSYGAQD